MDDTKKVTRRMFLGTSLGAGAGLTLASCTKALPRLIVPQVVPSDDEVPGEARFYRSVCRGCSASCGLTARVREGRAVKLEGNPKDPIGAGALCATGQAAIDDLYSPHRLGTPMMRGGPKGLRKIDWKAAQKGLSAGLKGALDEKKQIVVLTRPEPGAVGDLFGKWLGALGQDPSQVVTFDPMRPSWLADAAEKVFGQRMLPRYDLASPRLVVSIGADLIEDMGSPVEGSRAIASLRSGARKGGGRFVYVGPRLSLTAAQADRFLQVTPGTELDLVLGLCREVLSRGPSPAGIDPATLGEITARVDPFDADTVAGRTGLSTRDVVDLARTLVAAKPSLVVGPGRSSVGKDAVELGQAVLVLNVLTGALGTTMGFDPAPAVAGLSMDELVQRMKKGQVGALLIHHADPLGYGRAFAAFDKALAKVPFVATFVNRVDATAKRSHLVLADHHFLETWSEIHPRPGIRAIQQPVMTPLLPTRAAADVLLDAARTLGKTEGLPDDGFAEAMQDQLDAKDIARGGVYGKAPFPASKLTPAPLKMPRRAAAKRSTGPTLLLVPSVRHLDGRAGRQPLLEEIPDPITTVAWSGFVEVNPKTAARQGIQTGDVLEIRAGGASAELAAVVHPGVGEDLYAVPLAYAPSLLGRGAPIGGVVPGARITKTGRRSPLAKTGGSLTDHHRDLVREVGPSGKLPKHKKLASLYTDGQKAKKRWAMAVDLDKCNGCDACVAACYVENNCPVVGPDEVRNGRDMAWIHLDRYIETDTTGTPKLKLLPAMCQQCAAAPCEAVCPAYATYHTDEGLNAQIYNRCIGTRFCANDCPYVCRRFNWFDWKRPKPSNLALNPDVTVRQRGVMEKCTFCVQRIRGAEEKAKLEKRKLKDGEVKPACVETCSAEALVFGDLMDPSSRVAALAKEGRAYHLLDELNTQPGIVYLARRRHEESA